MRLRAILRLSKPAVLPAFHQPLLAATLRRFLARSSTDYTRWLYLEQAPGGDAVRPPFDLYAFSPVRSVHRRVEGETLRLGAGSAEWYLSSPIPMFVEDLAAHLRAAGALEVGSRVLAIDRIETPQDPDLGAEALLTCLSPVVATVGSGGRTEYLAPTDPRFGQQVRGGLVRRYAALYGGSAPADDTLAVEFDAEFLAAHRAVRVVDHAGERVRCVLAPLRLSGSPDLIRLGYASGLGPMSADGFGMVEAARPRGRGED